MRRTNTFKLNPTEEQEKKLFELANNCSRLWNEVNYKRRQSFFSGEIDWNTDIEYNKYKRLVGSATAQQIIRKNNEAWKSFFAMLKQKAKGNLPSHIRHIRPPGYWKNRKTSKRVLKILIRNDCYKLESDVLKLPFGLKIRWSGRNRWEGKQGRLEIIYDELSESWYAFQPVEVKPLHQPIGNTRAYCDLGIRVLIMAEISGEIIGYSGNPLLSDWWYWTKKIAEYQSELNANGKRTFKKLRKLYRKRKRRFRHTVNTIVSRFVEVCYDKGVSEIVIGDLNGIRNNNSRGKKANSMVHNFWSHRYLTQRIKEKAEEYGIRVIEVDESYTSSVCPRCGSKNAVKRKRLFRCLDCGLEAHRDAVGCVNIRLAQGGGVINGAVASPTLLTEV